MRPTAPAPNWSAGSIRITSRTVSAGEVSNRLGLTADRQFERGSLMSPRNPTSARRETSIWIRRSGLPDASTLTDHVRTLVELLDGRRAELASLSVDCDLELWLGFGSENGQGGCVLPAHLLAEVGALGLDVVLDLYPGAHTRRQADQDADQEEEEGVTCAHEASPSTPAPSPPTS